MLMDHMEAALREARDCLRVELQRLQASQGRSVSDSLEMILRDAQAALDGRNSEPFLLCLQRWKATIDKAHTTKANAREIEDAIAHCDFLLASAAVSAVLSRAQAVVCSSATAAAPAPKRPLDDTYTDQASRVCVLLQGTAAAPATLKRMLMDGDEDRLLGGFEEDRLHSLLAVGVLLGFCWLVRVKPAKDSAMAAADDWPQYVVVSYFNQESNRVVAAICAPDGTNLLPVNKFEQDVLKSGSKKLSQRFFHREEDGSCSYERLINHPKWPGKQNTDKSLVTAWTNLLLRRNKKARTFVSAQDLMLGN
jgi:hypothetical protein